MFDTTIHGVDYDKACDLVDAVESVNASGVMSRLLWSTLLLCASLLGCQQADVHPLPEGHVKGLVPLPASMLVPDDAPQGRGFRSEGSLSVAWPEGWNLKGMTSWLDRAGLAWTRTEGEEGRRLGDRSR